jgi:hypothetical protein
MPVSYSSHGGRHQVSVVHCPNICGSRLAHLSRDGPGSWALRDFITGQMIRSTPPPNAATSGHTLAQIEAEVVSSETPPFHSVENVADWATYLRLRTMATLALTPSTAPPNTAFGHWQPI